MQGVALDPLPAVEEPPQGRHPVIDGDTARILHGRAGAHLIGHRADSADAGRDVGRLGEVPSDQQGLEVAGRLEDLEGDIGDRAVMDDDPQRALSFDA